MLFSFTLVYCVWYVHVDWEQAEKLQSVYIEHRRTHTYKHTGVLCCVLLCVWILRKQWNFNGLPMFVSVFYEYFSFLRLVNMRTIRFACWFPKINKFFCAVFCINNSNSNSNKKCKIPTVPPAVEAAAKQQQKKYSSVVFVSSGVNVFVE